MSDESDSEPDSTETDLFERLEADVADRDGDPFETLSDAAGDDDSPQSEGVDSDETEGPKDASSDGGTAHEEADWVDELGFEPGPSPDDTSEPAPSEPETEVTAARPDTSTDSETAWRDLRDGVGDRTGDPFEAEGGLFEEMDTEALNPDAVWQELTTTESEGVVSQPQQRTYSDVSKHSYCEQCEHFSGPPDVACQYEGAEIVEFLDMETVRVVDCPIVAKRQKLEQNR